MRYPGPEPARSITDLVASCIEAVERDGLAAIEVFCRDHPERAPQIRQRMGILHMLDLLRPPFPAGNAGPSAAESPATRYRALKAVRSAPADGCGPDRSKVDRNPQ